MDRTRAAVGQAQPWTVHEPRNRILLTGHIPLAKLHGSLNWTIKDDNSASIYQDTRATARNGGTAAIVPPIPEKEPPAWLTPIWAAAEKILARATPRRLPCPRNLNTSRLLVARSRPRHRNPPRIKCKCRTYLDFLTRGGLGPDNMPPRILFTTPDADRSDAIRKVITKQTSTDTDQLICVTTHDNAPKFLITELTNP